MTQEELLKILHYDPQTGVFVWKIAPGGRKDLSNAIAGSLDSWKGRTYRRIRIDGKLYGAHQLAWLYVTGERPTADIDHIDGDGTNNRWDNLRAASDAENQWNAKRRTDNTSGFKGVGFSTDKNSWGFNIMVNGKRIYKYGFKTPESAFESANEFRKLAHANFRNDGTIAV